MFSACARYVSKALEGCSSDSSTASRISAFSSATPTCQRAKVSARSIRIPSACACGARRAWEGTARPRGRPPASACRVLAGVRGWAMVAAWLQVRMLAHAPHLQQPPHGVGDLARVEGARRDTADHALHHFGAGGGGLAPQLLVVVLQQLKHGVLCEVHERLGPARRGRRAQGAGQCCCCAWRQRWPQSERNKSGGGTRRARGRPALVRGGRARGLTRPKSKVLSVLSASAMLVRGSEPVGTLKLNCALGSA